MTAPSKVELEIKKAVDDFNENERNKFVSNGLTRCDACGGSSQAYVRCIKDGKDLLWCGHHFNRFMSEMVAQGWEIDNQLNILAKEIEAYNKKDAIT